jgi:glutamate racemase
MIGVLDSGVGGLSIYRSIKNRLPEVGVVYLADKVNFPYGEKTESELTEIVSRATEKLVDYGANIIVVACNSATVATISRLREKFSIPIIGIEPAIKQAAKETKTKNIGLIATKRTVTDHNGDVYAVGCNVFKSHNGELVSNIENDYNSISDSDLRAAMAPFLDKNIDSVVLGCTHYHFIRERLEKLFPEIKFYAPEEAIVKRLVDVISEKKIELEFGSDIFLVSAGKDSFRESLKDLLGITDADIREI